MGVLSRKRGLRLSLFAVGAARPIWVWGMVFLFCRWRSGPGSLPNGEPDCALACSADCTCTKLSLAMPANHDDYAVIFDMTRAPFNPHLVEVLFGLGFFVQFVGSGVDKALGNTQLRWSQPNLLWASLTMALLTLPVVIVSVEEALRSVPREYREASLALGATRFQTIRRVILPNAVTGILTGTILAVGRGAGEVAPILFTGVAYFLPHLPHSLSDQFMQLGYHLYIMSTQSPDVEATQGIQYASALVLLALTFTLNLTAVIFRHRLRARNG